MLLILQINKLLKISLANPIPPCLVVFSSIFLAACGGTALVSVEEEQAMGAEMSQQVEEQIGIYPSATLAGYVDSVGQRLVAKLGATPYTFQFGIVDQAEPNAFASPGGYIYVSRGILALINTEEELAGILAHEISHVTERHHARQASRSVVPGLLSLPGRAVGAVVSEDVGNIINAPITAAGKVYLSSYSRGQETDADLQGMRLAAKAGYDPYALGMALDKLGKTVEVLTGSMQKFSFFDSHPTTPTRLADIEHVASEINWEPSPPFADQAGFYDRLNGLWWGPDNPMQGVFKGAQFLQADLDITISLPEGWNHMNTPRFVGAIEPNERAFIALSGAGPRADPKQQADAVVTEMRDSGGIEPVENRSVKIGEWPGHLVRFEDATGREPVSLYYLFVSSPRNSLQLVGLAAASYHDQLRDTALSLRTLTPEERAAIGGYRVRIEATRPGESLTTVSERSGNAVRTDLIAAMNGLPVDADLAAGRLVKIVREETYTPD